MNQFARIVFSANYLKGKPRFGRWNLQVSPKMRLIFNGNDAESFWDVCHHD